MGDVPEHLRDGAVVGHVAAALAGDIKLAPQLRVALQQGHTGAPAGGGKGGHTSGRPAADHDDVSQFCSSTFS